MTHRPSATLLRYVQMVIDSSGFLGLMAGRVIACTSVRPQTAGASFMFSVWTSTGKDENSQEFGSVPPATAFQQVSFSKCVERMRTCAQPTSFETPQLCCPPTKTNTRRCGRRDWMCWRPVRPAPRVAVTKAKGRASSGDLPSPIVDERTDPRNVSRTERATVHNHVS